MFNEIPSLPIEKTPISFEKPLNLAADSALKIAQINALALKASKDFPEQAISLNSLASTARSDLSKAAEMATTKTQTETVQTSQQIKKHLIN